MTVGKQAPRPDHVFIGNHTWRIEWLTQEEWQDLRYEDAADAITVARRNLIALRLERSAMESHYQDCLWHEITHAVWDVTMLTHQDLGKQDDPEEFVIGLQTPMQLFVLRQNRPVVDWLLDDGTVMRGVVDE